MVYRKKYSKKGGKKLVKRERKSFVPYILPTTYLCRLKYSETITLNAGIGLVANYLFRANGCYDPNLTGTGHQPLGFDNLMALYGKFIVLGSKCKATFISTSSGSSGQQLVGIRVVTDTAAINNPELIREQKGVKSRMLGAYTGSQANTVVYNTYSSKKWFGGSNLTNTGQTGTDISSPSDVVHYNIFTSAIGSTFDPAACQAIIDIDYIVLFKDLKTLIGS